MAHQAATHDRPKKDFKGLYIGAALGVAATQICNYCLVSKPPPPPPPSSSSLCITPKLDILIKREYLHIISLYEFHTGTYSDPDFRISEIWVAAKPNLSKYFNIRNEYVSWFFPLPWESKYLSEDIVPYHPPLLTKDLEKCFNKQSYTLFSRIREILEAFIKYAKLEWETKLTKENFLRETNGHWLSVNQDVTWDENISAVFLQIFEFAACLGRKIDGIIILYSILFLIKNNKITVEKGDHMKLWYVALFQDDPWTIPNEESVHFSRTVDEMFLFCEGKLSMANPEALGKYSIIMEYQQAEGV